MRDCRDCRFFSENRETAYPRTFCGKNEPSFNGFILTQSLASKNNRDNLLPYLKDCPSFAESDDLTPLTATVTLNRRAWALIATSIDGENQSDLNPLIEKPRNSLIKKITLLYSRPVEEDCPTEKAFPNG